MAIATTALEDFKNDAKKMVVALVDMERVFVPPQHFIRLVQRRYVQFFFWTTHTQTVANLGLSHSGDRSHRSNTSGMTVLNTYKYFSDKIA